MGYAATPSQPLLAGRFPMKTKNVQWFGILSGLPRGVFGSVVWVPGQNVTLSGRWFPPLRSCGCCTSESCLLRSVSQAEVCNCAMDKMGQTGKTGGKGLLWPFQPMMHLSACPRDAAEHSLWGSCTGLPSASGHLPPACSFCVAVH